jgi:hypothetical protein
MNHYRSYEFYVPKTRAYRISASAQFFPSYCDIPTEAAAAELILELQQLCKADSPTSLSRHQKAMKVINDIYKQIGQQPPKVEYPDAHPLMVEPTLSSNPTAPRVIKKSRYPQ